MAISHQTVPPGGWKYYVDVTKTTLVAGTYEKLKTHLENHWQSNGIPPGNAEEVISNQLEEKFPELKR